MDNVTDVQGVWVSIVNQSLSVIVGIVKRLKGAPHGVADTLVIARPAEFKLERFVRMERIEPVPVIIYNGFGRDHGFKGAFYHACREGNHRHSPGAEVTGFYPKDRGKKHLDRAAVVP